MMDYHFNRGIVVFMKRIISAIAVLVFLLLSACGAEKQNTLNFSISSSETDPELYENNIEKEDAVSVKEEETANSTEDKSDHDTIPESYESRLLVAPPRDTVQPEIAAVIYDDEPFTVIEYAGTENPDDPDDIYMAFYSKEYVMSEYDFFPINLDDMWSNIAEGSYRHEDVYWKGYSTIDLDLDGAEELVYYYSIKDNMVGYYLIFTVIDGEVYSYILNKREMGTLKNDGTMEHIDGAMWCNIWVVDRFRKDGYDIKVLAKMRWEDGEDAFYVGDEKVTWEEFRKFCDEDRSPKGVLWTTTEADDAWLNYYSRE